MNRSVITLRRKEKCLKNKKKEGCSLPTYQGVQLSSINQEAFSIFCGVDPDQFALGS